MIRLQKLSWCPHTSYGSNIYTSLTLKSQLAIHYKPTATPVTKLLWQARFIPLFFQFFFYKKGNLSKTRRSRALFATLCKISYDCSKKYSVFRVWVDMAKSVGMGCRLEGRSFTFTVSLEAELIFRVFQPFCVLHYHPQLYCKVNDCGLKFVILRACLNILPKNTRPQYVTAVFQLKVYYKLAITGIAWCKAQKKAEAEQEGQLKIYIQGLR